MDKMRGTSAFFRRTRPTCIQKEGTTALERWYNNVGQTWPCVCIDFGGNLTCPLSLSYWTHSWSTGKPWDAPDLLQFPAGCSRFLQCSHEAGVHSRVLQQVTDHYAAARCGKTACNAQHDDTHRWLASEHHSWLLNQGTPACTWKVRSDCRICDQLPAPHAGPRGARNVSTQTPGSTRSA